MATPPNKCLRGIVPITAAAASNLASNINVPVAVYIYASNVGIKPEISYQKSNGDWVEITKPSTTPGIYEHPAAWLPGEAGAEAVIINTIGLKPWVFNTFQKWAIDNLYAFFKDLVPVSITPTPTPENPNPQPITVTKDNFIQVVNEIGLGELAQLLDTNGDGVPEMHGK